MASINYGMKKTNEDLFGPARLKIERASTHINDLNEAIVSFLETKPYALVLSDNSNTGNREIKIKTRHPIPKLLSLILGDAVHNLRSSLDVAVFSIVEGKTTMPWKVQFPFSRTREGLNDAISLRQLNFANRAVVQVIKDLEPFSGGNELLHGLNALDVTDKHKLIIPTARSTEFGGAQLMSLLPGHIHAHSETKVIFSPEVETPFVLRGYIPRAPRRIRRTRKAPYITETTPTDQPSFGIQFGEGHPFAGSLVVPKLLEVRNEVDRAVNLIAAAYLI